MPESSSDAPTAKINLSAMSSESAGERESSVNQFKTRFPFRLTVAGTPHQACGTVHPIYGNLSMSSLRAPKVGNGVDAGFETNGTLLFETIDNRSGLP